LRQAAFSGKRDSCRNLRFFISSGAGSKIVLEKSRRAFHSVPMSVIRRTIQVAWQLRVFFTENVFAPDNSTLRDALADATPRKVFVVLEDSLAQAQPELEHQIGKYFSVHAGSLKLVRPPLFVSGGEAAKNSLTLVTDLLSQLHRHHVDRQSYLLAIGGGALLDVSGFVAATLHRGVRLVRIPTTTLSQADSGIGVKNSLNAFGHKNLIGTFMPPFAVINDFNLLATLAPRDKRTGYAEAVKIACVRDANFFAELERSAGQLVAFEAAAMKRLIHRSAELNLDHLASGGDPFETGSVRPLDFGHWAAHKLEQLSHFRITHGEAVAIGMALDVIYSRETGLLDAGSAGRILTLLERLGFRLYADEMLNADEADRPTLLAGLEEYREHLGGELSVTLLRDLGRPVAVHEMNRPVIIAAIHELVNRAGGQANPSGNIH
jgi:3-dehydroquinate synthase